MTNAFMFYENFLKAIEQLDETDRANACYEFCKYGITGELPKDKSLSMFCVGVSASVQKYQGRGGNHNPTGKNQWSKEVKDGQTGQNGLNEQTETKTKTKTETKTKNKEIIKETSMKYGELGNVLLTENQYKHLVESINNVDKAIEELDTWLSKDSVNSKKYIGKNHYGFFKSNSWVWDRVGGYSKRTNIDMASEDYHQQLLKEARPSDEVVFIDGIWQILPF